MPEPSELLRAGIPTLILTGALLNLDKQVCGPFMVGRPLMVGLIMELIAHGGVDSIFALGVWLGLSAELLWLAAPPLGGRITPNAGLAVAAAFIGWEIWALGSGRAGPIAVPGSYLLAAPKVVAIFTVPLWALIMGLIERLARRLAQPALARIRADLAQGREPRFFIRNLYGLAATWALSAAFLSAAAFLNAQIIGAAALAPPGFRESLGGLYGLAPLAGLLGLGVFMEAKSFPFYLGGLLAGLAALRALTAVWGAV